MRGSGQDGGMDHAAYVFDGHNDLAWAMREQFGYDLEAAHLDTGQPRLHTDLPRLRAGGVGAQFWSAYVPCEIEDPVTATLEQIDFVRRLVAAHPDALQLALTADDVDAAVADNRIASLIGLEGGHCIGESLGVLRMMHALGARYLTLTHNQNTPWADSATDTPAVGGLSEFGVEVVREMNHIGMFVDLSHVTPEVMHAALDTSTAPVIFSHSSARALVDNPRNVPDDVLTRLPDNGGVCQVSFVPFFVSPAAYAWWGECQDEVEQSGGDPRELTAVWAVIARRRKAGETLPLGTVADVADHVDHVREVAGLDHVGIGGDYDGAPFFPEHMDDVSSYPRLWEELRARGWSPADLAQLGHGNLLRAMRAMEAAAG